MDKQVSAPTRPCLACEGTGCELGANHPIGAAWCSAPCPVCLGSGRVEAKASVADAVADAETLWEIWSPLAIESPRYHGLNAAYAMQRAWPIEASKCADTAAHAAFRAVPGLRGE